MTWTSTTLIFTAWTLAGCYTYRPLVTPEPTTGTRVSAELTDEGSRALSGEIGPAVEHVEGEVVGADSTGIELSVLQVEGFRGFQSDWKGEHVRLPRQTVAGWQERKLSVAGTGFLGGLIAGGIYAMYRLLGGPGLFQGGRGGGAGRSE